MLKKISMALMAAAFIGGLATAANADSVSYRLERQAAEIEAGRKAGSITWTEGIKLRRELSEIERLRQRYLANDGYLSATEKRVLDRKLKTAQRHIWTAKTNGHRRWSALPRVGR